MAKSDYELENSELEVGDYEHISPASTPCLQRHFGPGSLIGSTFTTIACVVGIGILSLPYAINLTGLCLGGLLLVLGMLASYYASHLLVCCSHLAHKSTYEEIGAVAYGKHMGTFVSVNMIANNYGSLVAYMALIQELPPGALSSMGVHNRVALSGLLWGACVTVFIVLPLSLARKVNAFRFSSVFSFAASVFITCAIVSQAFALSNDSFSTRISRASLAKPGLFNIALAVPLVVFTYTCQQNVLYIYQVGSM